MRKLTALILTILYSNYFYTQELNKTYEFIAPTYNKDESIQFKKGHNVYISEIGSDSITFIYYKFIKGKDSMRQNKLNNMYVFGINKNLSNFNLESAYENSNNGNDGLEIIKTHQLSIKDFKNYTTELYPRFKGVSAGIFTVPFKIRLKDFDFEQNVNIGMNLSFPFRLNRLKEDKNLLTPTIGIGLATVNLNPKNSNLDTSIEEDVSRTASAFSLSGGLMYQFTNTINIGFQYGFDLLGNNDKEVNWKYDRKPWLGIGINIGTSLSDNKKSNPNN